MSHLDRYKTMSQLDKKDPFASLFSSLLAVLQIQVSPLFFFSNPSRWHVSYVAGPQCEITVKSMKDQCDTFLLRIQFKLNTALLSHCPSVRVSQA